MSNLVNLGIEPVGFDTQMEKGFRFRLSAFSTNRNTGVTITIEGISHIDFMNDPGLCRAMFELNNEMTGYLRNKLIP